MLPLLFLLVNKRLVILLHWKYLFALTKRWAPLRHPSVGQSHGRDIDIQTWHNISILLAKNKSSGFHRWGAVLSPLLSIPPRCWRLLSPEQNGENVHSQLHCCASQRHMSAGATTSCVWGQPRTRAHVPFLQLCFCSSDALAEGRMGS